MDTINAASPGGRTRARALQSANGAGLHATFTRVADLCEMATYRGIVPVASRRTLVIHGRTETDLADAEIILRVDGWRRVPGEAEA